MGPAVTVFFRIKQKDSGKPERVLGKREAEKNYRKKLL